MSTKPDGGPAFPNYMSGWPGMTLRDYFAGQALAGMLANPEFDQARHMLANEAYLIADAMLAEREK